MTPRQAIAAIEFLKRVDLKGVEVFILHDVMLALDQVAKASAEEAADDRQMRVVGGAG